MRRVLALVRGRAQPDVLLRVRSDLALDLGHLHSLVVARVLVEEDCRELFVVDVAVAVRVGSTVISHLNCSNNWREKWW